MMIVASTTDAAAAVTVTAAVIKDDGWSNGTVKSTEILYHNRMISSERLYTSNIDIVD